MKWIYLSCAALAWACGRPAPEEVFYVLPPFELVDQEGDPSGSSSLQGKVWVASFIFTRCQSTCPLQTRQMARLQQRLQGDSRWEKVRLVSISVDPEHDTPAVLRDYAGKAGADPKRWRFLTGTREAIWSLSKDGFKLGVGEEPGVPEMPLFHSTKLALVDGQGQVRGYYDGTSEEGTEELIRDLEKVTQ